jgi:hypothetical protein
MIANYVHYYSTVKLTQLLYGTKTRLEYILQAYLWKIYVEFIAMPAESSSAPISISVRLLL